VLDSINAKMGSVQATCVGDAYGYDVIKRVACDFSAGPSQKSKAISYIDATAILQNIIVLGKRLETAWLMLNSTMHIISTFFSTVTIKYYYCYVAF